MTKETFTRKVFQGDIPIWIIFMLLCCFSLVEVFSATSTLAYNEPNIWRPIARHATHLTIGFFCVLGLVRIPSRYYPLGGSLLMLAAIALLAAVPFVGISVNDASRWIEIFGIRFQPSEIGKLACVIYVAFLLSKIGVRFTEKTAFYWIIGGVGIVCALILLYNLSTALLLGLVCLLMMFVGHVSLMRIGRLLLILLLLSVALLGLSKIAPETTHKVFPRLETWGNRLTEHIDDRASESDLIKDDSQYVIDDDNYQVSHAKIAIARGGLFGRMPGRSVQRDFLPLAYSDFIFAIIIEELGIVGGTVVLLLYIMLLIRVGIIARRCELLFPKYLVIGCGLMIVIQALTNMAVAVNLMPVTGQPLPLISRGGTSTVLTCLYFGIILSVSRFGAGMGEDEAAEEEEEAVEEDADAEEEGAPIEAAPSVRSSTPVPSPAENE